MPSPIAHTLAGLTIAHGIAPRAIRGRPFWIGAALVAANAPDIDFAAGLVSGSVNAFHGGPTHSLAASLAFAILAAAVLGTRTRRLALVFTMAFLVYTSHVLLDMACEPSPTRPGLPLLWPVSGAEFLFPWRPLLGIAHGGRGGGFASFASELFSAGNLRAVGLELALFAPPLVAVYALRGMPECLRRRRSAIGSAQETR